MSTVCMGKDGAVSRRIRFNLCQADHGHNTRTAPRSRVLFRAGCLWRLRGNVYYCREPKRRNQGRTVSTCLRKLKKKLQVLSMGYVVKPAMIRRQLALRVSCGVPNPGICVSRKWTRGPWGVGSEHCAENLTTGGLIG